MADESEFRRYLSLTLALAAREFPGSYRGNWTGALAAFAVPIAMLATYSLVFSRLIPVGVGADRGQAGYVLFLFAGLIVWNLFADVAVRAPSMFRGAAHYVRRPRFPLSVIVLAPCLASFYRSLPWLGVYLLAHVVLGQSLDWVLLVSILVLLSTMLWTIGIALVLAVVGLLIRDASELAAPAVTLLFFLSPVLYPAARLAELDPRLVDFNPMANAIWLMREVVIERSLPDVAHVVPFAVATTACLALGMLAFRGVRRSLPDLV